MSPPLRSALAIAVLVASLFGSAVGLAIAGLPPDPGLEAALRSGLDEPMRRQVLEVLESATILQCAGGLLCVAMKDYSRGLEAERHLFTYWGVVAGVGVFRLGGGDGFEVAQDVDVSKVADYCRVACLRDDARACFEEVCVRVNLAGRIRLSSSHSDDEMRWRWIDRPEDLPAGAHERVGKEVARALNDAHAVNNEVRRRRCVLAEVARPGQHYDVSCWDFEFGAAAKDARVRRLWRCQFGVTGSMAISGDDSRCLDR